MLAAAPVEVAAAAAAEVEVARDKGVDVETDMVVKLLALELALELGVGVTELTRTRVLVMVVVAVEVVVSSAATNGAATRQRVPMIVVNFILRIDSKVNINMEEGARMIELVSSFVCETLMRLLEERYVSDFDRKRVSVKKNFRM